MGSAALRGLGRILKGRVKPKVKGAYPATRSKGAYPKTKPKEYPKAGDKWKGVMGPPPIATKARPIIPEIKKTTRDLGKGAVIAGVAYAAGKAKAKKEAKAKETKEKLKKSAEEHKEKTKEKRKKYGKHHG
jgi:hypothetical protein